MSTSLSYQLPLRPALPNVYASKDYRDEVAVYKAIDDVIVALGLDLQFVRLVEPDGKASAGRVKFLVSAFRVLLVDFLEGAPSLRGLSRRLADSRLLQWFCGLEEFGETTAPSKSTIGRMRGLVSADEVRELGSQLLGACGDAVQAAGLGLEEPCDMSEAWYDATCLEANVHYPTDWVLMVDATKTLMKSIARLREAGTRHRMPVGPDEFRREMNRLCLDMSQLRGKRNGKKRKKKVLSKMVKLVRRAANQARKHLDRLAADPAGCTIKPGHQRVLRERVESVLDQLPEAIRQAEERILREGSVESAEKILSFYEGEIHVVKRKKGIYSSEFGNVLLVGEQRDGLLVDLELRQENDADVTLLKGGVERTEAATGVKLKMACADRGFHSAENEAWLEERGTRSEVCPRGKRAPGGKLEEKQFAEAQRRRAQTEGRISILKRVIMGGRVRVKGFANRVRAVAWAQISHNLWVLGRKLALE